MKLQLPNVTLFQADPNPERALIAQNKCTDVADFESIVLIDSIKSYEDYNRFIIKELRNQFTTSHILITQHDGYIVNPLAWTDEFLEYDYIGAAIWRGEVGNGGFSLRSKRFCEESALLDYENRDLRLFRERKIREKDYPNEDFFLCIENRALLESKGLKFAPVEIADKFSWDITSGRQPKYNGAFGFHSSQSLVKLNELFHLP